jgi:hypothetical protein
MFHKKSDEIMGKLRKRYEVICKLHQDYVFIKDLEIISILTHRLLCSIVGIKYMYIFFMVVLKIIQILYFLDKFILTIYNFILNLK